MVQFHALGGVVVTADGREVNVGGPRQRRLLTMLLIHRNTVVSVDRLTDAVFAGDPTPGASTTLRSYIARVRKVVAANGSVPTVVTQPPGYMLQLTDDSFDVARFERALAEGRSLLSRSDPAGAAAVLREALSLWRGDAYAEFADEDWVRPEAQRLDELRLVAHEARFEAELTAGRAADVVAEVEAMVAEHPLREAFVSQLMVALYRAGRHADALRAYQRHREVLIEELGLDPAPALRHLEERVLAHDPDLLLAADPGEPLRGYRLGERLGMGADGTVHAAHLPGVARDIVIRILRRELADSPELVRSFEATAQRIAGLHHPAIVPLHDYWREPGAAYVVMRRMHGGSLADRLERPGQPLTTAEVTAMVQRVGGALAAAHEAGLVHGRVSPRSVLFDEAGDAWLSDFDLGTCSGSTPRADVHGLAAMVRACLPGATGAVTAVIDTGLASSDPGPTDAYVSDLLSALAGSRIDGGTPPPNPYKGLRAFEERDADDFFGRGVLVDDIVQRLGRRGVLGRLVLVVGGSGTGKSSVVRAGLLPRVRQGDVPGSEHWFVTAMLPGAAPFKELAAALRRVAVTDIEGMSDELTVHGGIDAVVRRLLPPGGQLLLVIDQLEELFTSATERDQRRFLDGLVHAITVSDSRVRVVGTLRADFYDRPLAVDPFGGLVYEATVAIRAMSAAELEASITEPARRAGRHVEGALVAELVAATRDEPAGLPALQFTLFELAERADGDLTLAAYRELGGLSGAIAARAEALYRSLDDDERRAIRRLFGALVVVNVDEEPARRRASRTEVTADDPSLDALIDRWVDARLLSIDRHRQTRLPTIEPAHEALLREWPRLRRWIDEDRELLLVAGRLREAAATWAELDRDPGALYRGARLEVAQDTVGSAALGPQEREFLDASREARDRDVQEAAARADHQARANRRLRLQLVVIGVALVVALVGGYIALDQRGEAVDERRVAFARELASAADASLAEDPERSMLLALEAIDRSRDGGEALPEAIGALHQAISRSRIVLSVPDVGGNLDWSPDGSVFVTEGPEETGIVDVRDAETGESVRSWVGHEVDINEVAFDASGGMLATTGDDEHLRIWDVGSGDELVAVSGPGSVRGPSFSPDGRFAAAVWFSPDRSVVQVVEVGSGDVVAAYADSHAFGTAFSPDGSRVLISSVDDMGVVEIDRSTGAVLLRLGEGHAESFDAQYSPDGRWIATAHVDGLVQVWEAASGERRFTVAGHRSEVTSADWSADGDRLATGGNDGTARVYDVTDGGLQEVAVLSARDTANGVAAIAFSPDGDRVMTGDSALASTKVWDVSERAGAELINVRSPIWRLLSNPFSPDGGTIALLDQMNVAWWDVEAGREVPGVEMEGGVEPVYSVSPSPDGELAAVHSDRGLSLHELSSGRLLAWLLTVDGTFGDLDWSDDGDHLAYAHSREADQRGLISVVDRTGDEVAEIVGEPGHAIEGVAFAGGGRWVAEVRVPPRPTRDAVGLRVWDWQSGTVVLEVDRLALDVDADPSSDRIAFAKMLHGEVEIWDVGTGEHVRTLRAAGTVNHVSWSGDGRRVALAGDDGTVRVFDADDGRLEVILRGHTQSVVSSAFSPDGTRLASNAEGEEVRVWALDLDELVGIARERLTRTLDDDECRQYLRSERCGEG